METVVTRRGREAQGRVTETGGGARHAGRPPIVQTIRTAATSDSTTRTDSKNARSRRPRAWSARAFIPDGIARSTKAPAKRYSGFILSPRSRGARAKGGRSGQAPAGPPNAPASQGGYAASPRPAAAHAMGFGRAAPARRGNAGTACRSEEGFDGPGARPGHSGARGEGHRWQESNLRASVLETGPRPLAHRQKSGTAHDRCAWKTTWDAAIRSIHTLTRRLVTQPDQTNVPILAAPTKSTKRQAGCSCAGQRNGAAGA